MATPNVLQRCEECLQREDCRASVRARGPALCEIETIVPVVDYDQALAAGYRAVTSKSRKLKTGADLAYAHTPDGRAALHRRWFLLERPSDAAAPVVAAQKFVRL